MAEGVLEIKDSNFEAEVLQADKGVLVDFWAPWCGPCRAMAPVIDELVAAVGDKIKIVKCNVDENPVSPGQYNVRSIPTLVFFKDGKVVDQIVGMAAREKLDETISKIS
ncbi:MAG: thioredoxin [Deltaproteobacteria bacterium]|nr:thioredoxin [Deltaproteobacteria bacterium]MBW2099419.1 thioredoxin [Deltaproteobacteria bacterium]